MYFSLPTGSKDIQTLFLFTYSLTDYKSRRNDTCPRTTSSTYRKVPSVAWQIQNHKHTSHKVSLAVQPAQSEIILHGRHVALALAGLIFVPLWHCFSDAHWLIRVQKFLFFLYLNYNLSHTHRHCWQPHLSFWMMTVFMIAPLRSDPASAGMKLLAKVTECGWALSVSQQSIHHCVASHFLTLRTGSTARAAMNPLMLETQRLSSLYHTDTSIHLLRASQF